MGCRYFDSKTLLPQTESNKSPNLRGLLRVIASRPTAVPMARQRFGICHHRHLRMARSYSYLAGHTDVIWDLAWSVDGSRIATASQDGRAKIWDTTTGEELFVLFGHYGGRQSRSVVTGGRSHPDRQQGRHGKGVGTLTQHSSRSLALKIRKVVWAWSPGGDRIACGFRNGTAKVWDAVTGEELLVFLCTGKIVSPAPGWSPSRRSAPDNTFVAR